MTPPPYDAIIIGAGPAGLSAALVLARYRRTMLVIDAGQGRNQRAREVHGYLTRDCTRPADFLSLARAELLRYGPSVLTATATDARRDEDGSFTVRFRRPPDARPSEAVCRRLLLATGMRDILPPLRGLTDFYGSTVHHCPYCDGWEHRDRRIAAYGKGDAAVGLALALRTWSPHVTACTDGEAVRDDLLERAARMRIPVRTDRVACLEGENRSLRRVCFERDPPLPCDALFFNTGQSQRSDLPRMLGCEFKPDGGIATNDRQCTGVPGLYVAGDADKDVQFLIVAAAEGATAAVAINRELQEEDQPRGAPAKARPLSARGTPAPPARTHHHR